MTASSNLSGGAGRPVMAGKRPLVRRSRPD